MRSGGPTAFLLRPEGQRELRRPSGVFPRANPGAQWRSDGPTLGASDGRQRGGAGSQVIGEAGQPNAGSKLSPGAEDEYEPQG